MRLRLLSQPGRSLLPFLVGRKGFRFLSLYRLAALLFIILALWNPRLAGRSETLDVIFVADYSHSVGQEGKDRAVGALEIAERFMDGQRVRIGALAFGREPAWEFLPSSVPVSAELASSVGRGETDIAAALQTAIAEVEIGHEGRVVLVSDGNENRGDVSKILPILRSRDIPVWVMPVDLPQAGNEVYLEELVVPGQVDGAQTFSVKGAIGSLRDSSARVKLLQDGLVMEEQETVLRPGTNWINFEAAVSEQGNHTFELVVESREDTFAENNLLQSVVEVKGPKRIFHLHAPGRDFQPLPAVLAAQGYSVVSRSSAQASLSLPELSAFDLVVLDDVPAYGLASGKIEALERYVKDLGGGLVVIGGPNSYAAGGYDRTALARVLPVDTRPASRRDFPYVQLLFVIDKSESMAGGQKGATKLDLAKSAAVAAAEFLKPADQVGVLAFDAGWDWALPFRAVGRGEGVSQQLSSLKSEGGTDLYKALVEAHRSFSGSLAAIKHLLIISDGLTEKKDFRSLVRGMVLEGISVSTVTVGEDADRALMAEIAASGKGRAYFTADPTNIPRIFTTETLLVTHNLFVEELVQPQVVNNAGGPLKGLSQENLPPVRGYVLTHSKPTAELFMKAGEDPLLVAWRYGLGRVVAFTSDLTGRWGKHWVTWEEFPQWAGQIARYAMRQAQSEEIRSKFFQNGAEVRWRVDLLSKEGGFINGRTFTATIIGPDGATSRARFDQSQPGRYEALFQAAPKGVYFATMHEGNEGSPLITLPFVSPYPKEYRQVGANRSLLSRLASETGGEVLEAEQMADGLERLFTPRERPAARSQESWWIFTALALLAFMADIGLRRLPQRLGT